MDHELPKMYLLMHTKCVTRDWKTHICNLYISYLYLLHFCLIYLPSGPETRFDKHFPEYIYFYIFMHPKGTWKLIIMPLKMNNIDHPGDNECTLFFSFRRWKFALFTK